MAEATGQASPPRDEGAAPLVCARHPSRETGLRCQKCERPICFECAYQTPVGFRCRECADLRPAPTYDVAPAALGRGAAASLGAGAASGLGWALVLGIIPFGGIFNWVLGGIVGYAVSETVSHATKGKRGPRLMTAAAGGVVVAAFVMVFTSLLPFLTNDLIGAGSAVSASLRALITIPVLLPMAIGIAVATSRLR